MEDIKFGSVCSGIEAASVAWEPLGWKAAWFSEIEPFPSAVLAHHYPSVPNLGDMTKLPDLIRSGEVEAPDVFCGGTPCQAFSVAGLRRSLDDARGNLSLVFCEIANELDSARLARGEQPCIVFWENVPGVLSTSDNAFGCFLAGLAGEDDPLVAPGGKWTNAGYVLGPKRAVAWRVTDAQYFGVAQRRRRVFVVASAREGFDPAAVLFEFDGMRRDTAPSRETGEGAAGGAGAGAEGGSPSGVTIHGTDPTVQKVASYDELAQCLRARTPGNIDNSSTTVVQQPVITMAHGQGGAEIGFDRGPKLTCNHEAPIAAYANVGHFGALQEVDVSDPLRAKGGDTGNGGESLVCVHGTQDPCVSTDTAFALGRNNGGENAIAFSCKDHGGDAGPIAPTLRSMGHDGSHANAGGQVAVAVSLRGREGGATAELGDEVGNCLRASGGGGDKAHVLAPVAVQASQSGVRFNDTVGTLDANYGSRRHNGVMTAMQVRRLTPVECERLQGFPEIVKTCTITVFQHSNSNVWSSDQPSTNVLAALQSHKSQSNASPAEENVFPSNANAAELNLNVGQASSNAPVLVNAQIDLERQHLQLHSQGKLLLSASIADASEWCRLPIQAADFVQLSAALLTWLEKKAPHGRAESRLNTSGSFPLLIGNLFASQSGQEIEELASDAEKFTSAVKSCMKSITSEAGRNSQNYDSILQTLLCCVSTAISLFIPEETRAASSYALSVEVSHGYTMIPWRKKPVSECPDGPRYKALGNSWAVPNVRWIGQRIDAAIKRLCQ